jgi:hypothetical protein
MCFLWINIMRFLQRFVCVKNAGINAVTLIKLLNLDAYLSGVLHRLPPTQLVLSPQ